MEETYSIKDLINLLLSHLLWLIICTIIGGAVAFGFSKWVLPLEYSSHITMYVQSYKDISEDIESQNNISNSKQLVNTYIEVLKDDAVMNAVGDILTTQFDKNFLNYNFKMENGNVTPASLRSCINISSVTDTSAVKVTATTKNAQISAAICNDLASVAQKYIEEAVGVGSINTIDQAKVYNTPVSPNIIKNTALGMAAAFMLVVMIIFVIDFFDNTVKDTETLNRKFNKAIIGEVQQFGEEKKKKGKRNKRNTDDYTLLTNSNTPFNVIESYKAIRTNILFTIATLNQKIIAVSSPNPEEGKSTSATNLAIALAQTDSSVLLIDADMRKPVQHKIFQVKNSNGLSTLIIQKSSMEESIKKGVLDNLDLLPSGSIPPNPSELLASEQFKNLLEQFSNMYDYIVIDTPPVNVVSDAMVMKDSISGILLVVRYGKTTYEELSNCMKQIDFAQVNMLGFVLNGIQNNRGSSYNYKYKYKYKDYSYGNYNEKSEDKNAD